MATMSVGKIGEIWSAAIEESTYSTALWYVVLQQRRLARV
jgi:hypothetical protein